jgi:cell division protein FtsQ
MSRAPAVTTRASRRPSTARGARSTRPAARRPAGRTSVAKVLARVPISQNLIRRVRNWSLALFVGAACIAGVIAMGVPQMIGLETAHALGRMGFVVRNIQISGRKNVDRDQVYRVVMQAQGQDMPLVDLSAIRDQLLQLGWIGDARVSRRLPDTLAIDLVERSPAAVLQRNQRLSLIDAEGNILSAVNPRTLPMHLPLVIGPGVERRIGSLGALIATQPAIKPLVEGATWVGERRWDLRFQSGETLSLPEGDAPARTALATFVRKDQQERLLGQGYLRFDMRNPGQIVVRVSEQEARPPAAPRAAITPGSQST